MRTVVNSTLIMISDIDDIELKEANVFYDADTGFDVYMSDNVAA